MIGRGASLPPRGRSLPSALWARLARLPGIELVVFAVAFVVRLLFVTVHGGFGAITGYDPSVYYAASDALLHGRMPYRDYTLLHPPGIVDALLPFNALGNLTTDHVGFTLATVAFMAIGAVNAVLVTRIALRLGWGRRAALLGGLAYAVWFGSMGAEYLVRLEPLGNLFLLLGVYALVRAEQSGGRRVSMLCGAGFGAAAGVKIWWIVPLVLVLGYHLAPARRRRLVPLAGGAAAALLVICGPFFVAAPRQMWRMVVHDQLGRPRTAHGLTRLLDLIGVDAYGAALHPAAGVLVVAVSLLVLVALCVRAWRASLGPLVVALVVAQVTVLVAAPSWFEFYGDFAATGVSLVVAAGLRARPQSRTAWLPARVGALAGLAAVVAGLMYADIALSPNTVHRFPGVQLARAVRGSGCLMSDSPSAQIQLDRLSHDLAAGCPAWIDVSGRTYDVDAYRVRGLPVLRKHNPLWQRDLGAYLFSGDTVLLVRGPATGVGPVLAARLSAQHLLVATGEYRLYRTHPLDGDTARDRARRDA